LSTVAIKSTYPTVASSPGRVLYRFSVAQYQRMVETGILGAQDRVELLEGRVVAKVTHNPPHDCTISLVQSAFLKYLPSDCILRIQSALKLQASVPEPDLLVARGPIRRYRQTHPLPADVHLLVEVADSTLLDDREEKGVIYAHARIPVYWLVNIPDAVVEVYTKPRAGRVPAYRQRDDYTKDSAIPLVIDGREITRIPVSDLLP
jgi:Uma2 family endonuclease